MRTRKAFTLIELLLVIGVLAVLVALLLPAVQRLRQLSEETACRNNLRQIGMAMHLYLGAEGNFPSGYVFQPGGMAGIIQAPSGNNQIQRIDRIQPPVTPPPNSPGWGWAALLLPYVEQGALAQQIDYTLPVEAPTMLAARSTTLRVFTCPTDRDTGVFMVKTTNFLDLAPAATNSYAACYGAGGILSVNPDAGDGIFFRNSRIRPDDVSDGLSNTLAVGERCAWLTQTPWAGVMTPGSATTTVGAPVYISIVEMPPTMALARVGLKPLNDPYCEPYDFFSPHRTVVNFVFADGSVHGLSTSVDIAVVQALATRAGAETIDASTY